MAGIHPGFLQTGPELTNTYAGDALLQMFLRARLPPTVLAQVEPDLTAFGERACGELLELARQAEAQPPRHVPFDAWGRRIDHLEISLAWHALDAVAASEGLVAIGYERKSAEYSRLHQFAKVYLFHPSSAFYTCPLAMTDGAARVIELHAPESLRQRVLPKLTSRQPGVFWTSGQWMTEKTGGSDVSSTSTIARVGRAGHELFGDKWFTSATTAQMAMALAKIEGASDAREGLSLFFVELRDARGQLNKIRIHRLKDKLGTKALPTAELTLEGTPGEMIGGVGEGVKKVSSLLNITRIYNSVTALGTMARALALAKDYARKRHAFGLPLERQPLHLVTLANLQTEFAGCFVLGFHLIHLLGRDELKTATPAESALLRLMTPILKLWTAKQSISTASEVIESFGGAGYIEDTGLPGLLRDAQVFSIWEGTTNVLSLDALRAIGKEAALPIYLADIEARLKVVDVSTAPVAKEVANVRAACQALALFAQGLAALPAVPGAAAQQASARAFAMALGRTMAAALLLELGSMPSLTAADRQWLQLQAKQFCQRRLVELPELGELIAALEHDDLHQVLYGVSAI